MFYDRLDFFGEDLGGKFREARRAEAEEQEGSVDRRHNPDSGGYRHDWSLGVNADETRSRRQFSDRQLYLLESRNMGLQRGSVAVPLHCQQPSTLNRKNLPGHLHRSDRRPGFLHQFGGHRHDGAG